MDYESADLRSQRFNSAKSGICLGLVDKYVPNIVFKVAAVHTSNARVKKRYQITKTISSFFLFVPVLLVFLYFFELYYNVK